MSSNLSGRTRCILQKYRYNQKHKRANKEQKKCIPVHLNLGVVVSHVNLVSVYSYNTTFYVYANKTARLTLTM